MHISGTLTARPLKGIPRNNAWNTPSFLLKCAWLALTIPNIVPESQALMAPPQVLMKPHGKPLSFLSKKKPPILHHTPWPSPSSLMVMFSRKATNKNDVEGLCNVKAKKRQSITEFIVPSIATGATYKFLPLYLSSTVDSIALLPYSFLLTHYATRAWNSLEIGKVVKAFGPWYIDKLTSNPMTTKSITAGIIGGAGDYMAQWFTAVHLCTTPQYQVRRGLAVFIDGILSGPLLHLGYEAFERFMPTGECSDGDCANPNKFSATTAAIAHVLADTLILDTFFVGTTIAFTGILEGIPIPVLMGQFRADYFATLRASWITSAVLFPIQFSCFRYLPLRVRVLAVNCIDVIWDAVLSFYAHRSRIRFST